MHNQPDNDIAIVWWIFFLLPLIQTLYYKVGMSTLNKKAMECLKLCNANNGYREQLYDVITKNYPVVLVVEQPTFLNETTLNNENTAKVDII